MTSRSLIVVLALLLATVYLFQSGNLALDPQKAVCVNSGDEVGAMTYAFGEGYKLGYDEAMAQCVETIKQLGPDDNEG